MGIIEAIAAVLIIMWLLGMTVFHLGAIIHVLLVIAVVVFLLRFITGRTRV